MATRGQPCQCLLAVALLAGACAPALAVDQRPVPLATDMPVAADVHQPAQMGAIEPIDARPGDRILLACGRRYGPQRVRIVGEGEQPVRIGPGSDCADGQAPRVDGQVRLRWKPDPDGMPQRWVASVAGGVGLVSLGERPVPMARFPATGYLIVPARPLATSAPGAATASGEPVADEAARLPALPNISPGRLVGARLHARTREWLIEEADVADASGRLAQILRYPVQPRSGVYFSGKPWMLQAEPAWAFDRSSGQLWVQSASAPDAWGVSLLRPLLSVEGRGSVEIEGLQLLAAGTDALRVAVSGAVAIRGLRITHAAGDGIHVEGAASLSVEDTQISGTGRDGIFVQAVASAVVRGNRVQDAGLLLAPSPAFGAINLHGARSAVVERNLVERAAYIGIRFAGSARIAGNRVEDSCLVLSDCGAYYSWRRDHADRRGPVLLVGNLALRVGQGGDTSVKLGVNDWFAGIYLDEWTREVEVVDNLIVGANQAIYLHNAFDNTVDGNLVVGARVADYLDLVDATLRPQLASRPPEPANRVGRQRVLSAGQFLLLRPGAPLPAAGAAGGAAAGAVVGSFNGDSTAPPGTLPRACKPAGPTRHAALPRAFLPFECRP